MKAFAPITTLLLVGILLAGCSGSSNTSSTVAPVTERPALAEGRGAIAGLLIDDIYRPIPNGLILLQGAGLTATTDDAGQFTFVDVLPGSYIALVSAVGHEAAPVNVDVTAGEYTELEISARRIFSDAGSTITTQYSVFIPCTTSAGYTSLDYGGALCPADTAGSDYRPGLSKLDFSENVNVTYLVAELKANQKDNYVFVLRHDDGSSGGAERWGSVQMNNTDYGKVVLKRGEVYQTWQAANKPWMNENGTPMAALLFYLGQGGDQSSTLPTCTEPQDPAHVCYGVGQRFAIKANIILTVFLGEPKVNIEEYHVLAPAA